MFEGEWLNDEHEMEKKVVVSDDRPTVLHNRVEELYVPSESHVLADWKSLECSLMPRLRVLAIGSNCAFAGAVELVGRTAWRALRSATVYPSLQSPSSSRTVPL